MPEDCAPTPAVAPLAPTKPARAGERRLHILRTLETLLAQADGARVTTAALAQRLAVSEAALYRHFASKAQMFEGLIAAIENALPLAREATAGNGAELEAGGIVSQLLQFAEKNPGLARVMVGDALLLEHARLQQRMNLFFDQLEAHLYRALSAVPGSTPEAARTQAAVLLAFVQGRLQAYVRSGFVRRPCAQLDACLQQLLG